jgi:3-isopropylmalate/(R)-2-methylmalate dehydratase small subunit
VRVSREPFRTVTGAAAPLLRPNLDTDVIIRIDRMVSTRPAALAPFAFEAIRYCADGSDNPDFALNHDRFRGAPILIGGPNFGCGSSREPAVWAIMGLGIRCIVAPSFGDIFRANCHQNGLLPIVLEETDVADLAEVAASGAPVTVDLQAQRVTASERVWCFAIGANQRVALLDGLDDLDLALRDLDGIRTWEHADRELRPWAWITTRPGKRSTA